MKKWLIKWLLKEEIESGNKVGNAYPEPSKTIGAIVKRDSIQAEGLNCTLYKASGGHIVEFRNYDVVRDRNNVSLHVIPDDQDFGQSFSKIVTVELMRL